MQIQGLSLEQAPPYKIPLLYYIVAAVYLLLFSVFLLFYGVDIENRYYLEAIALTHILTLGFFTHVIFGTLFQMMPVIIGEAYKKVELKAELLLVSLNIGIFGFVGYFLYEITSLIYLSVLLLSGSFLYFALYSFSTIVRAEDRNGVVKSFMAAFIFFIIGSFFGSLAFLQYIGIFADEKFGDIHFTLMIFGVVFMLFTGVTYKIIPMFYVTKEYPLWMKKTLFLLLSLTLFGIIVSTLMEYELILKLFKILLAIIAVSYAYMTIALLRNRRRARGDTTVNLFYFSSFNLALGGLLWAFCTAFHINMDFLLGMLFGLGFVYGLINGMLYKIVPFLTWFHLSSKSVFEAEMSEVITAKMIDLQFYIFLASYVFFLLSLLLKSLLFVAGILFFISSSLLLYNLIHAYMYHAKMLKKAVVYEAK